MVYDVGFLRFLLWDSCGLLLLSSCKKLEILVVFAVGFLRFLLWVSYGSCCVRFFSFLLWDDPWIFVVDVGFLLAVFAVRFWWILL